MKFISEKVQEEIDHQICLFMDECLEECKQLLLEHKDKVQQLSETLLEKESVDLEILLDVLGPRPFESFSSGDKYIEEYLQNLNLAHSKKNSEDPLGTNSSSV